MEGGIILKKEDKKLKFINALEVSKVEKDNKFSDTICKKDSAHKNKRLKLPNKISESLNDSVTLDNIISNKTDLYALLDCAIEGKFIIDLEGKCHYVNKACLEILKYPHKEDLLGKDIHVIIHHSKQDGTNIHRKDCPICQVILNGERIYLGNEQICKADGCCFPVECWSSPIKQDGMIVGAVVSIFDITARKQMETALDEAYNKLSVKQHTLEESNIALKTILDRIETEKKENILHVQSSVNRIIMPIMRKIENKSNKYQSEYITLLKENLLEITSPFIGKLENQYAQLSPREIEICKFVKDGMSSKEIAMYLNVSQETVRNQRKNIRKKLNIDNKKINLASFLKTI